VGVSCALHLQRGGFHVTLLEAGPTVGGRHAASSGNAGTFAAYANVPVQRPGLWRDAPGMILDPRGPLRLAHHPHLLKMVPWGLGALASCAPSEVRPQP
jgi:D-amino-acid dehydrogenase